ncbi:MAG TPA: GNAT family N-acetyltransferase [Pseudomonas sp.]|uniref:GNAT family N-acetyltransferase n=1 Tax=Pseudomonas sp. TaxID=306 RepID=UPI002B4A12E4|nr:GNAT family N-acetyltransferase [Pseudomonas sp.]HKS14260.1 GNAT family N-acetyltransferase [Pseudomonas sp.]
MRASPDGQLWVARAGVIVAGLGLTEVPGGLWLTGLFVAPAWRGRRAASQLVEAVLAPSTETVWLFCHPDLLGFYQRLGFDTAVTLPAELAQRLARYQRSKPLVALARAQSSEGSRPGNNTSV